jgi:hypothetical protein
MYWIAWTLAVSVPEPAKSTWTVNLGGPREIGSSEEWRKSA